ncbi:MAG: hypothetical protein JO104_07995 [Candidatus Eremiobacteraeota bacterium]|nr:hypothetical protein [Candidatus Eremiobacteraeota bacterium]
MKTWLDRIIPAVTVVSSCALAACNAGQSVVAGNQQGVVPFGSSAIVLPHGGGGKTPNSIRPNSISTVYHVVYAFGQYEGDAGVPEAPLLHADGALFGTTVRGGSSGVRLGTVFEITLPSAERVIYSFGGRFAGSPSGGVIMVDGALVGATGGGGSHPDGIVYRVTQQGSLSVLHSFTGSPDDGAGPSGSLVNVNGTLYGTTTGGGTHGAGTVYSIDKTGHEAVVYSFAGGSDGATPEASLIENNDVLYGTTSGGGLGFGTVFSLTPSGDENVLYRFGGAPDGANPGASLTNVNGTLYGTTTVGGNSKQPECKPGEGNPGCGTLFSIDPSGKEKVVVSFGGCGAHPGRYPLSNPLYVFGKFYGTTPAGTGHFGSGVVFSTSTGGREDVLYSAPRHVPFSSYAGLIDVNGTLYGTAAAGGGGKKCIGGAGLSKGCGLVFALTRVKH